MKKMIKNLMLVAVAAMAFVGCQNDNDEMNVTVKKTVFEFTANIEETTRSYFGEKDEITNIYPTLWEGEEPVSLVVLNSSDEIVATAHSNVEAEEGATTAKITATFEGELADAAKLVAYIGSWDINRTLDLDDQFASQVGKVNHTLISDNEWDGKSAVVLNFSHAVAYGNMTITDSPVAISNLAKVIVALDGVEYSIGIGDMLESLNIWFACEPDEDLSTLTVSLVDKNGVTYSKSVNMATLPVGSKPLKFIKGHVSKFSISGFEKEPADHVIEFTEREYIGDIEDWQGNVGDGYKFSNDAGDEMVIYFGTTSLTTGVYTYSSLCESGCFNGMESYITLGGSQKYFSNGQVAVTIENELWHLVYTGTINGETYEATFSQFDEGVYEATIDSVEGSFNEWQNVFRLSFVTTDGDDFGVYSLNLNLTPATTANGIIPAGTYTVGASMGSNILGGMAGPTDTMSNLTAGTIIVEHGDKSYTFTIDVTNAAKTQIKATYTGRVEGVYDDFVHPGDPVKLETPQNVKATVIASYDEPAIEITWEAVENAYQYLVTCEETSDVNTINHEHECSTIFSSLDYDTTYNFTIVAYPVSESTEYKESDPAYVSAKTALNPATPADYEITLTKITAIDGNTISFTGDNEQDKLTLVFNPGLTEIVAGTYIPAPVGSMDVDPYYGTIWSSDSALEIGTYNQTTFNISSNYNQYGYYPDGGAVVTVSISGTTYTIVALLKHYTGTTYKFTYTGELEVTSGGGDVVDLGTIFTTATGTATGSFNSAGAQFYDIYFKTADESTIVWYRIPLAGNCLEEIFYSTSYNWDQNGYVTDGSWTGVGLAWPLEMTVAVVDDQYSISLRAVDYNDNYKEYTGTFVGLIDGFTVPGAEPQQLDTPTGLVATPDVNTVTVNWNAVANAESYDVTCGVNKLTVEGTTATFTDLTAGTEYTVTVVAKADGYEDSPAASTTVITEDAVEPLATINLNTISEGEAQGDYYRQFLMSDGGNNSIKITLLKEVSSQYSITSGTYSYIYSAESLDNAKFAVATCTINGAAVLRSRISDGTMTVANEGDNYTITFDLTIDGNSQPIVVNATLAAPKYLTQPNITDALSTASDTIAVAWDAVANATSYYVTCGDKSQTVTTTTATFTGLTADTEYTITVVAKANGYEDSPAASTTVTTQKGAGGGGGGDTWDGVATTMTYVQGAGTTTDQAYFECAGGYNGLIKFGIASWSDGIYDLATNQYSGYGANFLKMSQFTDGTAEISGNKLTIKATVNGVKITATGTK